MAHSKVYEIHKLLAKHAVYKGMCMLANAALALVFGILGGPFWIGLIAAVLITAAAFFFYIMQRDVIEISGIRSVGPVVTSMPVTPPLMIASWPIAAGASVLAAHLGSRLDVLWVWIAGAFAVTLIMQIPMGHETWKWASAQTEGKRKYEETEQRIQDIDRLFDRIRSGEVRCAACGGKCSSRCHLSIQGNKAAVLCSSCLPWTGKGQMNEIQGLQFFSVEL